MILFHLIYSSCCSPCSFFRLSLRSKELFWPSPHSPLKRLRRILKFLVCLYFMCQVSIRSYFFILCVLLRSACFVILSLLNFEPCYSLGLNQCALPSLRFDLASLLVWQLVLILHLLFLLET